MRRGQAGTWQYLCLWRDDGLIDLGATKAAWPVTDFDAAQLLAAESDGGIWHAEPSGLWYIWCGTHLKADHGSLAARTVYALGDRMRYTLGQVRQQFLVQTGLTDADWADQWAVQHKYAGGLLNNPGAVKLISVLKGHAGCADEDMSERHPELLNVANGTLDLRTGVLRPFDVADRITYCLDTAWVPDAWCPEFWQMVKTVVGPEHLDVAHYLVKLLGYSILGDNREQKIIFIQGDTGLGKSTLLEIVASVLGPLAHASQPELITVVRNGRNARTENSVRGKRFVMITEASAWMSIEESQVKRLTGERWIAVNQHYAKTEIQTPVTFTIWLGTNQMPTLTGFDDALRRRTLVFPGGKGLESWQMDTDKAARILEREREGILRLLVYGCQRYFAEGLGDVPWAVREATERYVIEQDTVLAFVADTMIEGGWPNQIGQVECWRAYQDWSKGQPRLGRNEFYERLRKHPWVSYNANQRRFEGVSFNVDWQGRVR